MRSQTIAPNKPAKITRKVTSLMSIIPEPTVLATAVPKPNAATKLKTAAQTTALPGDKHARRDDRRNRVGGVVKAVDVVEGQRDHDEEDDGSKFHRRAPASRA